MVKLADNESSSRWWWCRLAAGIAGGFTVVRLSHKTPGKWNMEESGVAHVRKCPEVLG